MQISIPVTRSKFTPNVKANELYFARGEKVRYRMRNGDEFDIIIDSKKMYMDVDFETRYGYESIFSDDNKRYFAVEDGIIDWEGKC